jgi:hypothetical protein
MFSKKAYKESSKISIMRKYCLMMPQQKKQRGRPGNYVEPFTILLVVLAFVLCGLHQKACLESKEISGYLIGLNDIPESCNDLSNKIIESSKPHEETPDPLKVLSKTNRKLKRAVLTRVADTLRPFVHK